MVYSVVLLFQYYTVCFRKVKEETVDKLTNVDTRKS